MPQEWREAESHSTQSVVPMLAYADGPAAMDWLIRVFGFRERTRLLDPGGRLAHGELSAGDGLVMLATPSPDYEGPRQQAAIFLLPHLAILSFAPELWGILPIVFVGALMFGWIRIKSGSILGSWLMHASGNVTMALMVAVRTSS